MKILIDTNLWISALISQATRKRITKILSNDTITILGHSELMIEIEEVANRPKIAKYIDIDKVKAFIEVMQERLDFVSYHSQLNVCRDEADNYLLAMALDNEANYLITGDKDLLVLNPYENSNYYLDGL